MNLLTQTVGHDEGGAERFDDLGQEQHPAVNPGRVRIQSPAECHGTSGGGYMCIPYTFKYSGIFMRSDVMSHR